MLVEQFYVCPVCAPTRAALMTGLYTQRTTAIDTYIGRAMMGSEETTIAEMLSEAGYATGIFGKWHLGDCYPLRPIDQGFDTALVHRGGGIGQPSDPVGAERRYTDPALIRDGEPEAFEGYCTDIYFDEAAAWITRRAEAGTPFFAYIATNAPHGPFHDVPEDWLAHYRDQPLEDIPEGPGHPVPHLDNPDRLARIFAMISNIDENVGKLLGVLDELEIADETLILYLHDNGPNTRRFAAGLRGMKSEVYEGGVRSPLIAPLARADRAAPGSPPVSRRTSTSRPRSSKHATSTSSSPSTAAPSCLRSRAPRRSTTTARSSSRPIAATSRCATTT